MRSILATPKKIFSLLQTAWGRTPVAWIWKKPHHPMDLIEINTSREIHPAWRRLKPRVVVRVLYVFMLVIWPLRVLVLIAVSMPVYGQQAKSRHGTGYGRQLLEQLRIGLADNKSPELYYKHELFSPDRRSRARYYLTGNTASILFAILDRFEDDPALGKKRKIGERLAQEGFPTIPHLATLTRQGILAPNGAPVELPDHDFVAKPDEGMQGQSVFRFELVSPDYWMDNYSNTYSKAQLLEIAAALGQEEDYIIQPRLLNHEDLSDLTEGGFATVRVITALNKQGETEVIAAVFKMPTGGGVADNFASGGIAAPVDIERGILGTAVSKKILSDRLEYHPDTGAKILGRKLPFWNELVEMTLKAHYCYRKTVFLGWDIGITQHGPVIVETNKNWDVDLIQRPCNSPLGSTRFLSICNEYLEQKPEKGTSNRIGTEIEKEN